MFISNKEHFEAQFIKKLSNSEAGWKKKYVAYKKTMYHFN